MSSVRYCMSFVRCSKSFIRYSMSFIRCSMSFVRYSMSFVRYSMSFVRYSMSFVRCSKSFVRCSKSFVRCSKSFYLGLFWVCSINCVKKGRLIINCDCLKDNRSYNIYIVIRISQNVIWKLTYIQYSLRHIQTLYSFLHRLLHLLSL